MSDSSARGRLDSLRDLALGDLLDLAERPWLDETWRPRAPLFFRPRVLGIEVTQAIQYHRAQSHLTDAADRGPDNSVPLIAGKPAWVRVYLRAGLFGNAPALTGRVVLVRQVSFLPTIRQTVGTLSPTGAASVVPQIAPDYATERGTLGSTLNFIVPADLMVGVLTFKVSVWAADGGSAESPLDSWETTLHVTLQQTLRLRGVLISYNGPPQLNPPPGTPNLNLPAPTLANLQATAAWTLTTNPVRSVGIFSSAGTLAWNTPLTGVATNPGGCSIQWLALNAAVAQVKANDGNRNDVIYYGLLPAGTPIANVGGCESSGVSTGPNGAQITMAHEVGHGAGLQHGPCGTPGDPAYPAYEPYDPAATPTASIGEYGLNINNGTILPPTWKDYMSYCNPVWISLFQNAKLVRHAKFDPQTVGAPRVELPQLVDPFLWPWEYMPDPPPWEQGPANVRVRAERMISVIGVVDESGVPRVTSVMRVQVLPQLQGERTGMTLQLLGARGDIAASASVLRLRAHGGGGGCGCGGGSQSGHDGSREGPFVFQALVADVEAGSALVIRGPRQTGHQEHAPDEMWRRDAPRELPRIDRLTVKPGRESLSLRWTAKACGEVPPSYSVQVSKDAGRSWNGVTVGLLKPTLDVPLDALPTGKVLLRVLVHDGFHTAAVESKGIDLPERAPLVSILFPAEGQPVDAGSTCRLYGAMTSLRGLPDPEARAVWLLDGEPVAEGLDAWITAPLRSGEHHLQLTVRDAGGKTTADVGMKVVGGDGPSRKRAGKGSSRR